MGKLIYNKTFKGTIVDTAPRAVAPTITPTDPQLFDNKVTFTVTNNEDSTATIFYGLEPRPRTNFVVLGANEESDTLELGGDLEAETEVSVNAVAQTSGKLTSVVTSESITSAEFKQYLNATGGDILEYNLDGARYRSHTFTTSGNFEVLEIGNISTSGDRTKVDYLIIAGGGGAGAGTGGSGRGGGAGAGGYRTTLGTSGENTSPENKVAVTTTSYPIIIGSGGAAGGQFNHGVNGQNSSAFGIESIGGGAGASGNPTTGVALNSNGFAGGSGGGGSASLNLTRPGGAGTANQGHVGGTGRGSQGISGGGGGAGSAANFGARGLGLDNILRTGADETRGVGGVGKGGSNSIGFDGDINTGNGGDGSAGVTLGGGTIPTVRDAGNGGSGIVVIRYEIAPN